MKTTFLITSILLIFSMFSVAQSDNGDRVMIENESKYSFNQTIDSLNKIITSKGWKVTYTHDMQETMKKNGKEVLPVKIIELCNPSLAYQILGNDQLKYASPMLPCRLSVFEKSDGKVYIARINAIPIAGMIEDDASKTILTAFQEVEDFLELIITK